MRGDVKLKILDAIARKAVYRLMEAGVDFFDALVVITTSPYGSSYNQLMRNYSNMVAERDFAKYQAAKWHAVQERVSQLKRDGLVAKDAPRGVLPALTAHGKKILGSLRKQKAHDLPNAFYKATGRRAGLTIVTFDIPEKEKKKREWLRNALKNLGFTMLHQSVWMGEEILPAEFIEDLRKLKIFGCVESLEVSKRGSLQITRRS